MRYSQRFLFLPAFLLEWIVVATAGEQFVQQGSKLVVQATSVSLSADGNTAIVGGWREGAAWVFTRSEGVWTQQGDKLVGTGAGVGAQQGHSVSLSGDGNTAIVGGPVDSSNRGAAWVFTRSGGVWSQQGAKLVGTGAVGDFYHGYAQQGFSVSLSGDGNTAIVGGPGDSSDTGAAWVFTRSMGVWSQQGAKLVGMGVVGAAYQGWSVSLSWDGNTALVGGYLDNGAAGAVWVFIRSGGVWSQQGDKLVGTGAVRNAEQGTSVSLSADGNTALVGGRVDSSAFGATWVFTRSWGVWSQQGNKLVGTGAVGIGNQGYSVSLSADGNTALVGGWVDNRNAGAAWVFTRSGGVWSQQGDKLVGTGAVGSAWQGCSVSLSGDGNTAIIGGEGDNNWAGAAWVFVRTETGVGEQVVELPQQFSLGQNYPNPFNPTTTIRYEIPGVGGQGLGVSNVRLIVYDLLGREVAVLVNEKKDAGVHEVRFDGSGLASGIYLYRLQVRPLDSAIGRDSKSGAGDFVQTKRLVILK